MTTANDEALAAAVRSLKDNANVRDAVTAIHAAAGIILAILDDIERTLLRVLDVVGGRRDVIQQYPARR
jgi:hypothetical protein